MNNLTHLLLPIDQLKSIRYPAESVHCSMNGCREEHHNTVGSLKEVRMQKKCVRQLKKNDLKSKRIRNKLLISDKYRMAL